MAQHKKRGRPPVRMLDEDEDDIVPVAGDEPSPEEAGDRAFNKRASDSERARMRMAALYTHAAPETRLDCLVGLHADLVRYSIRDVADGFGVSQRVARDFWSKAQRRARGDALDKTGLQAYSIARLQRLTEDSMRDAEDCPDPKHVGAHRGNAIKALGLILHYADLTPGERAWNSLSESEKRAHLQEAQERIDAMKQALGPEPLVLPEVTALPEVTPEFERCNKCNEPVGACSCYPTPRYEGDD